MKKLFTIMLLVATTILSYAQDEQKIYFWKNDTVDIRALSEVDSITFSLGKMITFSSEDPTDISETGAKIIFHANMNVNIKGSVVPEYVGTCYSKKNSNPTVDNYVSKLTNKNAKAQWTTTFSSLKAGTTYYYRPYAILNGVFYYGDVKTFKTSGTKSEKVPEYVDLGLSVKWATCNLGVEEPEDKGAKFAWGETSSKSKFTQDNYKWIEYTSSGSVKTILKYTNASGHINLDSEDDAATAILGEGWRMPTKNEMQELIDSCTWSYVENSGGFLIKSKKNGKTIFLPFKSDSFGNCHYWTNELSTMYDQDGTTVFLYKDSHNSWKHIIDEQESRYYGYFIRPVRP